MSNTVLKKQLQNPLDKMVQQTVRNGGLQVTKQAPVRFTEEQKAEFEFSMILDKALSGSNYNASSISDALLAVDEISKKHLTGSNTVNDSKIRNMADKAKLYLKQVYRQPTLQTVFGGSQ